MRGFAMDLIKKSTAVASARLQFCRLAFGAAGSAGASIDTGDAESVARGLIGEDKTKLEWNATRALLPKNKVKLILNLVLIAGQAIPRGGVIKVTLDGMDNDMTIKGRGDRHQRQAAEPLAASAVLRAGEHRRCAWHPGLLHGPRRQGGAPRHQGSGRGR